MRVLYFDGQSGAAGDMILGALIDLGVDPHEIESVLRPIVPGSFSLHLEKVQVYGVGATRLTVTTTDEKTHRHLHQVIALLDKGSLSPRVRVQTEGVFRRLAEAEGHVHGSTPEKVHFHEVGANDAVIDVIGSLWAMEKLAIDNVHSSPLVLGGGVGRSAHGPIAYPAPAVVEILKGKPTVHVPGIGETTTPTGAAILAEVADFSTHLSFTAERVGNGAGHKELPDRPNLLRATLGSASEAFESDELWLATSDIDNTRPEVFEWLEEKLRLAGAVDVVFSTVAMKKSRLGTRVEVLCRAEERMAVASAILTETASLGVRWQAVTRTKLPRRIITVETPWGPLRVKVADTLAGARYVPEYDDCRAAAAKHGVPLLRIIETTTQLADRAVNAEQ
jgi:hypothetical protein